MIKEKENEKNVMAAMVSAALAITALFGAARQYPVSAEKGISESVYSWLLYTSDAADD